MCDQHSVQTHVSPFIEIHISVGGWAGLSIGLWGYVEFHRNLKYFAQQLNSLTCRSHWLSWVSDTWHFIWDIRLINSCFRKFSTQCCHSRSDSDFNSFVRKNLLMDRAKKRWKSVAKRPPFSKNFFNETHDKTRTRTFLQFLLKGSFPLQSKKLHHCHLSIQLFRN